MPPQAAQEVAPLLAAVHAKPVLQVPAPPPKPPPQHAWPAPPQAVQACVAPAPVQAKPVSQVPRAMAPPPAQQAWPPPPHASHVPAAVFVLPVHRPPAWQTAPAQHAPPTLPQSSQVRAPMAGFAQPRPVSQVLPVQQALPIAPQGSQVLVTPPSPAAAVQARPAVQAFVVPPVQHSPPEAPHAVHIAAAPVPVQA